MNNDRKRHRNQCHYTAASSMHISENKKRKKGRERKRNVYLLFLLFEWMSLARERAKTVSNFSIHLNLIIIKKVVFSMAVQILLFISFFTVHSFSMSSVRQSTCSVYFNFYANSWNFLKILMVANE